MKWLNRAKGRVEYGVKDWLMHQARVRMEFQKKRLLDSLGGKIPAEPASDTLPPRVAQIASRFQSAGAMSARLLELCKQEGSPERGASKWLDELFYDVMWLWWQIEKGMLGHARLQYRTENPPGRYINWFADTFFTVKTREMVIEPLVADYRREVADAIQKGWLIRERYLDLLYGVQFLKVALGKWFWAVVRILLWWH